MKKLRNGTGYCHLLANLVPSEKGGLLRTGIFSLLLHFVLVIFLILNLKSAIPQGRSNVYWVTIRPTLGQAEVKRSFSYEVPDQSALTTVRQWKFIPARKGEVAVLVWVNIPIRFQLL